MLSFSAVPCLCFCFFFFFNDTATTEIYTLSLHDALPICAEPLSRLFASVPHLHATPELKAMCPDADKFRVIDERSEEHTSELQSRSDLVCRLLLEKKKKNHMYKTAVNDMQEHDY